MNFPMSDPGNHQPPWAHGDSPIRKEPGELGPPAYPHEAPYTEYPPGSGNWWPDHRPLAPGSTVPAGLHSGGDDTYPSTGDPALDEAIRQTFTNLRDIRDAHGTGQTPVDGSFFAEGAQAVRGIQDDIAHTARSAASHWTGQSGEVYQRIAKHLSS